MVVACSSSRRAQWSHALKSAAVDVEIVSPELDQFEALAIGDFDGRRTLQVSARPLNVRDRLLKRALDLAVASTALLVLSPVMLAASVAIMVDSGGPVLFRQQRVGRNNRLFKLMKFRSFAHASADPTGIRSASRTDERMTRVGKFIRRTSLDELPQLINVILGHMSIVGPRPHALGSTAENDVFWKIDNRYFHRHAVKPGMTGLLRSAAFAARPFTGTISPIGFSPTSNISVAGRSGGTSRSLSRRSASSSIRTLSEPGSRINCLIAITFVLLLPARGFPARRSSGGFLTGDAVVWPDALSASSAIYSAGDSNVATVDGIVTSAMMGPATVRDSYRAIDVGGSASVGRFEAHDIDAEVNAAASARMRTSSSFAARVVHDRSPQVGRVNMPFGLQVASGENRSGRGQQFRRLSMARADGRFGTVRAFRLSAV